MKNYTYDANVLIQLVIESKQHCNVSRADIGRFVTKCLFWCRVQKERLWLYA